MSDRDQTIVSGDGAREERARLLRRLRSGDVWGGADPELEEACRSLLVHHFGLETWSRSPLFDPDPESYLVAEAVAPTVGADGVERLHPGCQRPEPLTNWSAFTASGCKLAPVSRTTWLLPVRGNRVEVRAAGEHVELALDIDGTLPDDEGAELDLYLDPGWPPRLEPLEAFASLLGAAWPNDVAFPDADGPPWPRRGLRPVWETKPGDRPAVGPEDLLAHVTHPYEERFARLPLGPLRRRLDGAGRLTVGVRVGRGPARLLADALEGRLRVNHVLFFNRVLERIDPSHGAGDDFLLEGGPAGGPPLVLECLDLADGSRRFDRRWAGHIEPARLFELRRDLDADGYRLRFVGPNIPPGRLRLAYLRAVNWRRLEAVPGRTVVRLVNGDASFLVRTPPFPGPDDVGAALQERLLLGRLAAGRDSLPFTCPETRAGLVGLVLRLLPPELRAALDHDDPQGGVRLLPQVRRVPEQAGVPPALAGTAVPITTVALQCKPGTDRAALAFWVEGLRRRLRGPGPWDCLLDVRLEIGGGQ